MRTFEINVAAALIRSSNNRIVLGRKYANPKCNGLYPGQYVLPGGVYRKSIPPLAAALAETREETGLDIFGFPITHLDNIVRHLSPVWLRSGEVVLYDVRGEIFEVDTGMPWQNLPLTCGSELANVRWVPEEKLYKFDHCAPSEILFQALGLLPLKNAANLEFAV
ncbi:MAG TPA: NUDIX hydrolase [Candidatus Saccharimonadales bacterium]|nr:NUDIX hydrolase [Candidatus Saccharimonadales bacterium]